MFLALGGGWVKPKNGVSHFLVWGLFCGVSVANTTKQTWQTVQFSFQFFCGTKTIVNFSCTTHCPHMAYNRVTRGTFPPAFPQNRT